MRKSTTSSLFLSPLPSGPIPFYISILDWDVFTGKYDGAFHRQYTRCFSSQTFPLDEHGIDVGIWAFLWLWHRLRTKWSSDFHFPVKHEFKTAHPQEHWWSILNTFSQRNTILWPLHFISSIYVLENYKHGLPIYGKITSPVSLINLPLVDNFRYISWVNLTTKPVGESVENISMKTYNFDT